MPYVISSTIVSFFATMMFNPTIGFLNTFFEKLGLHQFISAWVGDPKLSFKIMIALVIWQGAASGMMIFYANMMDVPQDIIEASRIDGCSEGQRLTFMLGGPTGGVNSSLDFVNLVFYRYTFGSVLSGEVNLGFGASISVTMFIIIMIVTFIQNKVLTKFEYDT